MYDPWLDSKGYPVCSGAVFDGGDCAADLGTVMALNPSAIPLRPIPWDDLYMQPLRYWDITKWSGLPNRFSRDQLIPLICGFIRIPTNISADKLFSAHKKRLLLTAWNTVNDDGSAKSWPASMGDPCGPEVWALWIRLLTPWWGWFVLWFLDLQTLIGAVQWRWFTDPTNQLTRNHMLVSITAKRVMPSPTSLVIYYMLNDWPDLIERWRLSNQATREFPTADLFQGAIDAG